MKVSNTCPYKDVWHPNHRIEQDSVFVHLVILCLWNFRIRSTWPRDILSQNWWSLIMDTHCTLFLDKEGRTLMFTMAKHWVIALTKGYWSSLCLNKVQMIGPLLLESVQKSGNHTVCGFPSLLAAESTWEQQPVPVVETKCVWKTWWWYLKPAFQSVDITLPQFSAGTRIQLQAARRPRSQSPRRQPSHPEMGSRLLAQEHWRRNF